MVINNTRAVAVKIQALWPESTTASVAADAGTAKLVKNNPARASGLRIDRGKDMGHSMKQKAHHP